MQCHAIVLNTTGTTYARQQPRYFTWNERKTKDNIRKKGKEERNGEKRKRKNMRKRNKYSEKCYEQRGRCGTVGTVSKKQKGKLSRGRRMILQQALDLILKRKNKETLRLVQQVAAQGADAAHLFLRRYVRVVGHTFVTCTPSLTPVLAVFDGSGQGFRPLW